MEYDNSPKVPYFSQGSLLKFNGIHDSFVEEVSFKSKPATVVQMGCLADGA